MDVSKFFIFLFTLWLITVTSSAINFAISASVSIFATASLCLAMIYVTMMVSVQENITPFFGLHVLIVVTLV